MKTPPLVKLFDMYGHQIPLQIFGEEKRQTTLGAIISVFSLLFMGTFTIYLINNLFQRTQKTIVNNLDVSIMPYNDINSKPIILTFNTADGKFIAPDDSIFKIHAYNYFNNFTNYSQQGVIVTPLDLHRCTEDDLIGLPQSSTALNYGMCLSANKQNISLKSRSMDLVNGWNSLYFILSKCNPKIQNNCKKSTVIDSILEGGSFVYNTQGNIIDNNNLDNPAQPTAISLANKVSASLYKVMTVFLTQNLYSDDLGYVFESLKVYDFYTQGDVKMDYSLKPPSTLTGLTRGNIPVSTIMVFNSPFVYRTYRSFTKAQECLANIGGVVNNIMLIGQIITQFITRKMPFIEIGNKVFDFKTEVNADNKRIKLLSKPITITPVIFEHDSITPSPQIETQLLKQI